MPDEKPNDTQTRKRHKAAARTFTLTRVGAAMGSAVFECPQLLGDQVEVVDAEDYRDALKQIAVLQGFGPGPGDPQYTIEVKRQEIVSCLKYLGIMAVQENELELARTTLTAAEFVDDLNIEPIGDQPWTGL